MKFTYSWLKKYLDTTASVNEVSDTLTKIGIEVEEIINPADALKDFIIADVKTVTNHPNSDHLHILSVWTGKETLQVVCGAPNVYAGMKSVLAQVGVLIPKFNERIEKGVIRGVESQGMMCAEDELCIGDDHTGIIDLKTDLPAGTPFTDYLKPDIIWEVEVTPNRPDCYGVEGIARDLAATGIGMFNPAERKEVVGSFDSPVTVSTQTNDCPCFTLRYIRGVKNGESPDWLKKELSAVGLRPISVLVDITNYFNIGQCRPLHVFDANKIQGNLTVRGAKDGEKIVCLDEKEYTLSDGMVVVADEKAPQSIAGVMGGSASGVDENTTNVLLESAYFEPISVAKTGRILNCDSDSRVRFERGVDPLDTIAGNHRATQMILDLCGGEASHIVVAGQEPQRRQTITFDWGWPKKMTGMDIPKEESIRILKALGFDVNGDEVVVPSWRWNDVSMKADLVEEIARIYGYETLPESPMRADGITTSILLPNQKREIAVRRALANAGLNQAITWSFMDSKLAKLFGSHNIRIQNPIASDLDELRPSLVPNLLSAVGRNNGRAMPNVRLFEVGPQFFGVNPNEQEIVACAVRSGQTNNRHWANPPRAVDAFDAKADALTVLAAADVPMGGLQILRNAPDWYHPGRSGALCLGRNVLGYFGEIHPLVLKAFGIKEPVVACEVFLDKLPPAKAKNKTKLLTMSNLMPLSRDFAFVMDKTVDAANLMNAIKGLDKELISDVRIFDVYEGDKLPDGKKSIALEVVIQPKEKTLTDRDIELLSDRIIAVAGKVAGATLRA